MTPSAYPAARAAAGRIQSHFARHLATPSLQQRGEVAALPDTAAIEGIIGAAFCASLRREEGYMPRTSLAFVAPEAVERPLRFERRLPLAAQPLTRLSPAVERPGIHLGVWRDGEALFVWGATRNLPASCLVLEVIAPGLLVVKHSLRRRIRQVRQYRRIAGRRNQDDRRAVCPAAGLPVPVDFAARLR